MKFVITLTWLALSAVLTAAPKYAVVRVTDIYRELASTEAFQKQLQQQRDDILKNKRAEQFRISISELQALEAQLKENKDQMESETGQKLIRDYEIKRQEAETIRQEFEQYSSSETKRINKEMVAGMRASLQRITGAAEQIAKERNLDGVFDISGNSNTGVPFVLFVGDAPDLTDDVIELLDDKPLTENADPAAADTGDENDKKD